MSDFIDYIPSGQNTGALGSGFQDYVPEKPGEEKPAEETKEEQTQEPSWQEMVSAGKDLGVYKRGMKKEELKAAIEQKLQEQATPDSLPVENTEVQE